MNLKGIQFENSEKFLCNYGCEKMAKYIISNGKLCCSEFYTKCEGNRRKYGSRVEKNPMYEKVSFNRYCIDDWKEKYSKLFKDGELQEVEGVLHSKCFHCKILFIPKYEQLRSRGNASNKDKKKSLFFCSEKCKQNSIYFRRRYDPENLKSYSQYVREVRLETERSIKDHNIKNIELRGKYPGHQLDHKYSIRDGFDNEVNPKIVGNWKNLEILTFLENDKKKRNSSTTIEQLMEEINNDKI